MNVYITSSSLSREPGEPVDGLRGCCCTPTLNLIWIMPAEVACTLT